MGTNMKELIGGLLVLLVGLVVSPTISIFASQAAGNSTAAGQSAAAVFYTLVPFFWAFVIIAVGVGLIYAALKS